MRERITTVFIICSMLIVICQPREIELNFRMNQLKQTGGWLFVGKMGLGVGVAQVNIRTEVTVGSARNHGGEILVSIVPDDRWAREAQIKCGAPIQEPMLRHELLLQGSLSISQHSVKITRQQLYYLVIKDCGRRFETDYDNEELQVRVVVSVVNNGAYMGEEEDHWFTFPVIIGIGLWMIMSDKYFLRGEFQLDPDYAKMILFGAIGTNISSLMWRSFGYIIYLLRGSNFLLFHIIYLFMHAVSQTMVIALLVLVSMGWSLNYLEGPRLNIAIPGICFIGIFNIVLTLMTQLYNTAHDMHHTFDAPTGYLLILVRLVIGLGFLISICITYHSSRYRVRQFLIKFGFFGFLYLCSMPIVIFLANCTIPAQKRNEFVFIAVQSMKTLCNISLMYMVSSSQSEYNKLCYKNASFLPNQAGLF